jgi:hypothetical protein
MTATQLIAQGITGKQLRDALRREHPTWSNAQIHTVAKRMGDNAGLTASAHPRRVELELRRVAKDMGLTW